MFCKECGTQNSDDAKFCSRCGSKLKEDESTGGESYSNSNYQGNNNVNGKNGENGENQGNFQNRNSGYNNYNGPRPNIPNYLVWSILSTIFCCLPFGIVAIVYASKVNSNLAIGNIFKAQRASDKAKNWTLASFICGIIYLIIIGIIFVNNM